MIEHEKEFVMGTDMHKLASMENWWPRLRAIEGLNFPETVQVGAVDEGLILARQICLVDPPDEAMLNALKEKIRMARDDLQEMVYQSMPDGEPIPPAEPFFLRTGHTAAKHGYHKTCRVYSLDHIFEHINELAMFHEMVCLPPITTFFLRRLLKVEPAFYAFEGLPITLEMRGFVQGGKLVCKHAYWPIDAIQGASCSQQLVAGKLNKLYEGITPAMHASMEDAFARVAKGFANEGAWSIDLLWAEGKWWATDMAPAGVSYHETGCDMARTLNVPV